MPIIKGENGKVWGKIEGDTYFTYRRKEHFCYKYQTYGIQTDVLKRLRENKIKYICIITETKTYKSSIDNWLVGGIKDTLRLSDGEQVFLPLHNMRMDMKKDKKMSLDGFISGNKL